MRSKYPNGFVVGAAPPPHNLRGDNNLKGLVKYVARYLGPLVSALHVLIPTMARMLLSTMMLISAMVMILVISPKPCLLSISWIEYSDLSTVKTVDDFDDILKVIYFDFVDYLHFCNDFNL